MTRNLWHGTIAHVQKITDDGRVVDSIFADLRKGVLPLIDATTQEIVGAVDMVGFVHDRSVSASGFTTLPPGEYPVGIDLDHLESQTEDGTVFRCTGRLIALHVNRGRPAWPDVKITVEAES